MRWDRGGAARAAQKKPFAKIFARSKRCKKKQFIYPLQRRRQSMVLSGGGLSGHKFTLFTRLDGRTRAGALHSRYYKAEPLLLIRQPVM